MKQKRILFYCSATSKKIFSIQKFLREDIQILKDLGYKVSLSLHWYDFILFYKYDIAFIYFYRYGLIPAILATIFRKKIYFTGGIDFLNKESTPFKTYIIQCIFFKLCNIFSTKSILVSEADVANVKSIYHNKLPHNCTLVQHCIDTTTYLKFASTPKEKIVVTIALMERIENINRKGVLKAIETFNFFQRQHPEYKMIIIGKTGKDTYIVYDLINQLNLTKKISLTGNITEEDKIQILSKAEFYLQLSSYEGFGIASLEALASGCKVIHSGKGGLKYIIGNLGFEVPHYDNALKVCETMEKAINTNISLAEIHNHMKKYSKEERRNAFYKILNSIP